MIRPVSHVAEIIGSADGLSRRLWPMLAAGVSAMALGILAPAEHAGPAVLMAGLTLTALASALSAFLWLADSNGRRMSRHLNAIAGHDPAPCFTTDATGIIGYQNAAAQRRFGHRNGATLIATLNDHFSSPSSVLFRLQNRAEVSGAAQEDVLTRRGNTRLSVHRISVERYFWRLDEFHEHAGSGRAAESLSLPMLVANKTGVILFSNDALRRLTGERPKTLNNLFRSDHRRSGQEVEVRTGTGTVRAIYAEVDGSGERREIYLLPASDMSDDPDVTADFEGVPVALAKFAPDGRLRAANRIARDLLRLEVDADLEVTDLFEGLGRSSADWLSDVACERMPGGNEVLRMRRTDGESFFQVTLSRIVENGRVSVLAVLNDATALKTLEAQFQQSQKMQAMGQLAGGMAHDFNNLLTAISGHCDLLLLRHDRDDPEYADLVQINQNANRAAAVVGQLLAFSRKQTLTPERLELQDVLSDLAHLLNRLLGERVSLKIVHARALGPIRADKRKLEQVIMNLAVNARDAMPSGGTILIETEAVKLAEDLSRDRARVPAGKYAVIRVMDTGCGMPPERLEKIFEPFFTTKKVGEGTGLGLSMAYGIIKQSGGFIFCDSEVDKGTVFTLYFPVNDTPAERKQTQPPQTRASRRRTNGVVLLVEDEGPVRAFASRALQLRGYTVLEAQNAEEALKILEDAQLEIDVFVTDVVMPGMDGPSWVAKAMETRPDVRVVFVSGYAEECLSESQARIPNSVFLPKPFSLAELTETVQSQMA